MADTSALFALMGVPLILVAGAVAWAGRIRFLAAQKAMRVGDPLGAPVIAGYLPLAVVLISGVAGVVAVFELLRG